MDLGADRNQIPADVAPVLGDRGLFSPKDAPITAAAIPPIDLDDAPVTRPFLPSLEEFQPYLEQIWANRWLTNSGPFHQQFESELATYLGVEHVALTSNGTAALGLAFRALDLAGDAITTPFTFCATSHEMRANGLSPVFVDIDPQTGNLDPSKIEDAITERTSAIVPVHCFGHPCRTAEIGEIARRHGLKVVYDAAHAFGIDSNAGSLLAEGDAACLSFHATKVFNTFEGGAVVCADAGTKARIEKLRNFGFGEMHRVDAIGTNAKMNEIQAAFGLLQLRHVDRAIAHRGALSERYRSGLAGIERISTFKRQSRWRENHSYFPILLDRTICHRREELCARLLSEGIHARPYFWPLVCDFPVYEDVPSSHSALPAARDIADRVLCLPLYPDLALRHVYTCVRVIRGFVEGAARDAA